MTFVRGNLHCLPSHVIVDAVADWRFSILLVLSVEIVICLKPMVRFTIKKNDWAATFIVICYRFPTNGQALSDPHVPSHKMDLQEKPQSNSTLVLFEVVIKIFTASHCLHLHMQIPYAWIEAKWTVLSHKSELKENVQTICTEKCQVRAFCAYQSSLVNVTQVSYFNRFNTLTKGTKIQYNIVHMINRKCKPYCCLFAIFPIEGSVFFLISSWQIQTNVKKTLFPLVRRNCRPTSQAGLLLSIVHKTTDRSKHKCGIKPIWGRYGMQLATKKSDV